MRSINLLPPSSKTKKSYSFRLSVIIVLAVTLLGVQSIYYRAWTSEVDGQADEIGRLHLQIDELRQQGEPIDKVNDYKQALRLVEQLRESRVEWKAYLAAIVGNLPQTTKIITIDYSEESNVKMELDFTTYEEVIAYMRKLEQAEQLDGVTLSSFYKKVEQATPENHTKKYVYKLNMEITLAAQKGAR